MPGPIPLETRQAAVNAMLAGKGTREQVAAMFGVSVGSLARWLARERESKDLAAKPMGGSYPLLDKSEQELLVVLMEENPTATLHEIQPLLTTRTGKKPSIPTMRRYLNTRGFHRRLPKVDQTRGKTDESKASSYRYRDVHRRESNSQRYPTSLMDAEWELIEPLFPTGGRGRPPEYERRHVLDAIFYAIRSGCPWRMLPNDFPPWQNVYASFRRWSVMGLFEKMHDRLRQMWREREGRQLEPTGAIIDSQSVKTAEKGGSEDTTGPRR